MATAPKKATPKKPQDHKPKAEELRPEDTPGWELMRDMNEIPVWEQMPLIALLQEAFDDADSKKSDEEIDAMSKEEWELYQAKLKEKSKDFDVNIIGRLAQALIPYAKDEAAYTKFASGAGAMGRIMGLAMAWVGQMGEFGSSEA